MKVDTFQCDVCGAQKKETNHWWLAWVADFDAHQKRLCVMPWNYNIINQESFWHLCGEKCVIAKVSEFLSK